MLKSYHICFLLPYFGAINVCRPVKTTKKTTMITTCRVTGATPLAARLTDGTSSTEDTGTRGREKDNLLFSHNEVTGESSIFITATDENCREAMLRGEIAVLVWNVD